MQHENMQHEILQKTPIFELEKVSHIKEKHLSDKTFYRLLCPDWVNVLPITSDHEAVLIRQYRGGVLKDILELPGGVVEEDEKKDPTLAAVRELEEETGYSSRRILPLASQSPNPATHSNQVHFFLALQCGLSEPRKHFPDENENIKVELYPVSELEKLVRFGEVNHALAALCIMLAQKYLK